jgi:hypothetical protein
MGGLLVSGVSLAALYHENSSVTGSACTGMYQAEGRRQRAALSDMRTHSGPDYQSLSS